MADPALCRELNVTQHCRCSPMLIFRAWDTCASLGLIEVIGRNGSLPADVLWGSFVTHSYECVTNEPQTDVCGEAREMDAS